MLDWRSNLRSTRTTSLTSLTEFDWDLPSRTEKGPRPINEYVGVKEQPDAVGAEEIARDCPTPYRNGIR